MNCKEFLTFEPWPSGFRRGCSTYRQDGAKDWLTSKGNRDDKNSCQLCSSCSQSRIEISLGLSL